MSNKSPDQLIKAYHNAPIDERYWILLDLTYINDPRVTKIITLALSDDDGFMRRMAAQTLAVRRFNPSTEPWHDEEHRLEHIKILTRLIEEGQEKKYGWGNPCMTCIALASIGGMDVIHLLIQTLTHSNPALRESAQQGLGILLEQDEEATIPYILRLLDSNDVLQRTGAALVLQQVYGKAILRLIASELEEGLQVPELAWFCQRLLNDLNGIENIGLE